jgi:L-gulonate 3-dehydrogenase
MVATTEANSPLTGAGPIAVIGAGSIGTGWAIVFASAGWLVRLHDVASNRLQEATEEIADRLHELGRFGLIAEPASAILARITVEADLAASVADTVHVQECAPEDLELKQGLFAALDAIAPEGCPIASSTSFIPISRLAAGLSGRERCLVVHPGNPPYLLRVAEIVPAPFTVAAVVDRTERLLAAAGIVPVRVAREVEGFVFNRLQGALLREAYCLVRDGVAAVADIDRLVRDGLGLRWSVVGPFETVDLNTRCGIAAHAARMGPAYARMGEERRQGEPWSEELVAAVVAARRAQLPLSDWPERVAWRDRLLMARLQARAHDEPGS